MTSRMAEPASCSVTLTSCRRLRQRADSATSDVSSGSSSAHNDNHTQRVGSDSGGGGGGAFSDDYAQRVVNRLKHSNPHKFDELVKVHLSHDLDLAGPSAAEGLLEAPKLSRRARIINITRKSLRIDPRKYPSSATRYSYVLVN